MASHLLSLPPPLSHSLKRSPFRCREPGPGAHPPALDEQKRRHCHRHRHCRHHRHLLSNSCVKHLPLLCQPVFPKPGGSCPSCNQRKQRLRTSEYLDSSTQVSGLGSAVPGPSSHWERLSVSSGRMAPERPAGPSHLVLLSCPRARLLLPVLGGPLLMTMWGGSHVLIFVLLLTYA